MTDDPRRYNPHRHHLHRIIDNLADIGLGAFIFVAFVVAIVMAILLQAWG